MCIYPRGGSAVGARSVCGTRGMCTGETGGGFRARMPGLGLRGCVGGEIRAEVLRPLLFELGLLFGLPCAAIRLPDTLRGPRRLETYGPEPREPRQRCAHGEVDEVRGHPGLSSRA